MKLKHGKYLPRKNTPKSQRQKSQRIENTPDAQVLQQGFGYILRPRKKRR